MKKRLGFLFCSVVLVGSFFLVPAHAEEVGCGDVLRGGTQANPARYELTRNLYCTTDRGVRMPHSYTELDCRGHTIRKWGAKEGFGILMGGGRDRRVNWQQVRNCAATGWAVGLRNQFSDDTLVINGAYYGNHIGIFSIHTTISVVLNISAHANGDMGMYFHTSYHPYIIRSSASSNEDTGIFLKNSPYAQLIDSQARRNGDPDLLMSGTYPSLATHHSLVERGTYDEIMFANGAHDNILRCVTHGGLINPGPTNVEVCP